MVNNEILPQGTQRFSQRTQNGITGVLIQLIFISLVILVKIFVFLVVKTSTTIYLKKI